MKRQVMAEVRLRNNSEWKHISFGYIFEKLGREDFLSGSEMDLNK